MHELKKYPNRRLYDMTESRYVTVEDVRALIVKGESIHVVDGKDGQDITRSILLQILAEQEAEGHESVLTDRVIEQMIRFYGDRMGGLVGRYIEQSILAFLDHQDQLRAQLRQLNDMNPLNLMRQAFDPAASNSWTGRAPPEARDPKPPEAPEPPPSGSNRTNDD